MNNLTMFYRIVIQDIRHNLDLEQRLHRLCNIHNVCLHSFLTPHILHVLIKIIIMLILHLQYHLIIYGKMEVETKYGSCSITNLQRMVPLHCENHQGSNRALNLHKVQRALACNVFLRKDLATLLWSSFHLFQNQVIIDISYY